MRDEVQFAAELHIIRRGRGRCLSVGHLRLSSAQLACPLPDIDDLLVHRFVTAYRGGVSLCSIRHHASRAHE